MIRMTAGAENLRGSPGQTVWSTHAGGSVGRMPIETLGRRDPSVSRVRKARERRPGEILVEASVAEPWKVKPRGASSSRCAKHMWAARDSRKAEPQELRPVEPAPHLGAGYTVRRNSRWGLPPGNGLDTFREEKAPKGESQERCRCETKPARDRGE
jgi:hypothetical protein